MCFCLQRLEAPFGCAASGLDSGRVGEAGWTSGTVRATKGDSRGSVFTSLYIIQRIHVLTKDTQGVELYSTTQHHETKERPVNERIDIYVLCDNRWQYLEGNRMFRRLSDAQRHYSEFYGQPVQARWSER